MTYIFHVLGMPTTASTYEYVSCAFTQCIIHFCKMMKSLGHTVYHYGHKDSTVLCDHKIEIFNNEDLEEFWGENYVKNQTWKTTGFLCRTLRDMIRAINSIHTIEPELCIQMANKYTLESIAPRYQEYFDNIYTIDFLDGKNGWFTL